MGEPRRTLWDLLLNTVLAGGLPTNLQSNTNDHTGATKRERSWTQENKYNFQAGLLKPCASWVMKTIDYETGQNKTQKVRWQVKSGCSGWKWDSLQPAFNSHLQFEGVKSKERHKWEFKFGSERSVCVCVQKKLESHEGCRSVQDQISRQWQRPGSMFACDSLCTQMATSSSCLQWYSSMKMIIKDVHTAQLQIRTHSHLTVRGASVRLTQYTLIHQEGSQWLE